MHKSRESIDKQQAAQMGYDPLLATSALSGCEIDTMKELEKILKDLQKRGYQQVDIGQVLSWMYNIQKEKRLKRAERRQNER